MIIISIFIVASLLCTGSLLSAIETAITASSPGRIHKLKAENNKKATIVLSLLKTKDKVINTLLIGNSIINTVCTTIATGIFIDYFDEGMATLITSVVMSLLIIIVGEVVPKAVAIVRSEEIALFFAPTITIFLKLLTPVNATLDVIIKVVCFVFRINLKTQISGTDEVRGIIEHHHQEGHVYKSDRDMLGGVLDISDMTVSEIMVHRSNIVSINIDLTNKQIITKALSVAHTRIPLWKDSQDNIVGILHIKDLLKSLYNANNDVAKVDIKRIINKPWFVPENALVSKQLNAFRERKTHFACVVDEYGDLQGIITLEDVLEVIVGQIYDEHDSPKEIIIKKSENTFIINGIVTIRDINRELNWNLSDENATTIVGLIIHELERIPEQGETIEIFNLKITILKKVANKIDVLKVIKLPVNQQSIDDT